MKAQFSFVCLLLLCKCSLRRSARVKTLPIWSFFFPDAPEPPPLPRCSLVLFNRYIFYLLSHKLTLYIEMTVQSCVSELSWKSLSFISWENAASKAYVVVVCFWTFFASSKYSLSFLPHMRTWIQGTWTPDNNLSFTRTWFEKSFKRRLLLV